MVKIKDSMMCDRTYWTLDIKSLRRKTLLRATIILCRFQKASLELGTKTSTEQHELIITGDLLSLFMLNVKRSRYNILFGSCVGAC